VIRAQRDGVERFARFIVAVIEADAGRDPSLRPVSLEAAYLLVSGLRDTIVRAVERGDGPARAAGEGKQIILDVLEARTDRAGRPARAP
jgi:hypothetical protein